MCKILIRAEDNTHPDLNQRRHIFRKGELVSVRPDESVFGQKEIPPKFIRLDFPGVSVADAEDLLEGWHREVVPAQAGNPSLNRWLFIAARTSSVDDQHVKGGRCEREDIEATAINLGGSVVNASSNNVLCELPNGGEDEIADRLNQPLFLRRHYLSDAEIATMLAGTLPVDIPALRALMMSKELDPRDDDREVPLAPSAGPRPRVR